VAQLARLDLLAQILGDPPVHRIRHTNPVCESASTTAQPHYRLPASIGAG
jgi:hypothetical protein